MSRTTLLDFRAAMQAGHRLVERGTVRAPSDETLGMARLICEAFDLNPEYHTGFGPASECALVEDAIVTGDVDGLHVRLRELRSNA